ncbi:MAG: FMN-binding negative transcriptional regulator [Steroidobacteraceae bacterium]
MYVPSAFRAEDLASVQRILREARLCNLITATASGLLCTPLPVLLEAGEGPHGTLYGHVARGNPHWRAAAQGEALALFMGADAYISPSWYASKQQDHRVVPTWNYEAVHAYGPVEFFQEPERLLEIVRRLTDRHEQGRPQPWSVDDAPADYIAAQLKAIVGVRLPITRLEGKRKLSQNRSIEDRIGVIAGLSASPEPNDQAMAALISKD